MVSDYTKFKAVDMKEKLVIIGANDFQAQLIKKAKELGYETHVFAWEDGAVGKTIADYFYPISIVNKDEILAICKKIKPSGVCSIASEVANITVNYLARKLGLVCNSAECVLLSTNKHEMRKAFERNGDPSPKSFLVDQTTDVTVLPVEFPVLVKPTDRSGSRGITKVLCSADLEKAIMFACEESFEKKALVEEFVEGKEYSVEFISYKGQHTFLALTEKFTTGAPHYIEFAHKQPAIVDTQVFEDIKKVVMKALDTLKIEYGASHSEVKVDKNGTIKIIEIGSRMGGGCIGSDLVPLSTGYDYIKMVIDVSRGKAPDFFILPHHKAAFIRFIITQQDFDMVKHFKFATNNIVIREATLLSNYSLDIKDETGRYGYAIFASDSEAIDQSIFGVD